MQIIRSFSRAIKPIPLVTCLLMYGLGVGISDYQGEPVNFKVFLLGQTWIILIHLSQTFLSEYFSPNTDKYLHNSASNAKGDLKNNKEHEVRKVFWWGSLASWTCVAVITVLLFRYHLLSLQVTSLMMLIFICIILLSTPPFRVQRSGFGEFLHSFWSVLLIPAFAYTLQKHGDFRLFFFLLSPLFFLHIAMQLALALKSYEVFPTKKAENFLDHFGWRIGLHTHNASVFLGFLFFGLGYIWGLPKFTLYIGLSILPVGVIQFLQMRRIVVGSKPQWNLIDLAAYSMFFLSAYLLTYGYWVQ